MSSDSLARSLARTLAQQNLRGIWEKYYPDAHAVLFLVDSNDIGRMDDARRCLHSVARNKDLDGAPLLVAVNKQDKLDEELRAAEAEDAAGASGGELRYRSVDASANDGGTVPSSSPKGQSAGAKRVESDVDGNGNGIPRRFRTYSTADVLIEFGLDEMAAEKGGPVRVQPTSAVTGYAFTFLIFVVHRD